jgi:hypothetical protein
MSRSTDIEHATRINATLSLLHQKQDIAGVVQVLCRQFVISRRQAYRYIEIAECQENGVVVPELKKVFTVKLPIRLIGQIRQKAQRSGRSISDIVTEALRHFLTKR